MGTKIKKMKHPFTNYSIHSNGKIYSNNTNSFIKPFEINRGYLCVNLWANGKEYQRLVHVLVAEYFVDNPNKKEYNVVNHKDNNPKNNNSSNLEWTTQSKNIKKALNKK